MATVRRGAAPAPLGPGKPRYSRGFVTVKKLQRRRLTRLGALAYIATTHGAPPLGAMTRLCEAPHLCKVTSPDAESGTEASTALRSRRDGTRAVPGCLTGESEERETWTGEALRAASSERSIFGSIPAQRRSDETSAVHVSGQPQCRDADGVVRCKSLHVGRAAEKVGPRQTL